MTPELAVKEPSAPVPVRFQNVGQIFEQIEKRFQQIAQRAYQLFEENGRMDGHDLDHWLKAESELLKPVPVELEESDNEFVVRADVPGFRPEELKVALDGSRIFISGKSESQKKEEKKEGKIIYSEQTSKEISRVVTLPAEVIPEQATANLKDGRLEITVAKTQAAKGAEKKIAVRAA